MNRNIIIAIIIIVIIAIVGAFVLTNQGSNEKIDVKINYLNDNATFKNGDEFQFELKDANGNVIEGEQEKTDMYKNIMRAYEKFNKAMDNKFYNEYVPKLQDEKLNKLIEDYNNDNIKEDVYLSKIDKPYQEFYTSSLPNSAEDLNKLMKPYNVEVYYFPKTN